MVSFRGFISRDTIKEMQSHYWNNTLNAFYHKTLRELKERGLDPMKIVEIESEELDRFYQSIKDEANG